MHYYAEVHPRVSGNLAFIRGLGVYDGFNIPDSPLGEPAPLPLVAACLIRRVHDDKRIMVNQRLLDINELHLISIAQGALMINADLVLTRGDRPRIGKEVGYLTSEDALRLLKGRVKGVRVGLMLSMRYGKELIDDRMRSGADFYLVLRLSNPVELRGLDASRLIPYVLVETERNSKVINRINQPHFKLSELGELLSGLREIGVEGVLLSAPGDHEALINLTRYFT
ncbi:hypothetical protein [Caldivirga sp. UBA161]|uniref:hypothetical protein n=1 Tax=Caldivirga sp. UBA161 TaxID=1915569 RepID=UPI0025C55D14|nr:hypothetical protein [Caldivirga sp. UBA161]